MDEDSSGEEPYEVTGECTTLNVKNFSLKRAVFECHAKNGAGTVKETFLVGILA